MRTKKVKIDYGGREYIEYKYTDEDGEHTWREYKIDRRVAELVKDKFMGLNGEGIHTPRALSIAITGTEGQIAGRDLARLAAWTLDENIDDWDDYVEQYFRNRT